MKKHMIPGMIFCLALSIFCLFAPKARAAEHAEHCICGGSVSNGGHAQCEAANWEPVPDGSNKIAAKDGGFYYLTGNLNASLTVSTQSTVTICLNGYRLQAQCPISVSEGGTVNICDCQSTGYIRGTNVNNQKGCVLFVGNGGTVNFYSGKITGKTSMSTTLYCRAVEVTGGNFNLYGGQIECGVSDGSVTADRNPGYGGNILVESGRFSMYGGRISGGTASKQGGNIYGSADSVLLISGGTVEGGSSNSGGNLYCMGDVTLEGATLTGGVASGHRGNVYISSLVDLRTNTVTNGMAGGKPEVVRLIRNGHYLVSDHVNVSSTVTKLWKDADPQSLHLQLTADYTESYTATKDIYLDLNGHSLSGITLAADFYGMDTAGGGLLNCELQGGQVLGLGKYHAIAQEGGYGFYTGLAAVTHISIDTGCAAMGYRTRLTLPGDLAQQVAQVGYDMWLDGFPTRSYSKDYTQGTTEFTLRLKNILSPANSQAQNAQQVDMPIHAVPFLILKNGEKIALSEVSYSFHDALEGADDHYSTYTSAQKTALRNLFTEYHYLTRYWHVENFHHVKSGSWPQLSSKGLLALVRQSSTPTGSYRLTEDVDLGTTTVLLREGADLTLCLDGHSITGEKQLFRVEGGSLTICDCHEGNNPGTLRSSLSGTSGVFAPVVQVINDGVLNLYGGQLKGQNLVRSAGVVAIGHQTKDSNATFNMYGGSISEGQADFNGGLLNIWHGSTFHMYGGALYAGQCNGSGGGLVVRDGSTANLYGGRIYGCQAGSDGGGVEVLSGASCYMGDVEIYGNTAQTSGGNIYASDCTLTLDSTTVTGGVAGKQGGGLYQYSGKLYTKGKTRITDNSAQVSGPDLHLHYYPEMNADGLTQGAKLQITAAGHKKIGTDMAIAAYIHCLDQGFTPMEFGGDVVLWNGPLLENLPREGFQVGYGKVCSNPTEAVPLAGYGDTDNRISNKIDGDLYITATAITDASGQTVLLLTADLSTMAETQLSHILNQVSYYTGVPTSHIMASTSHTHSAPSITSGAPAIVRYNNRLDDLYTAAALMAMNDRKAATMYTGSFEVTGNNGYGFNFTRHYQFTDAQGETQYSCDNFGERDLDQFADARHVTQADPTMHLVQFKRQGGSDVLLVNWRAHPTLSGGPNALTASSDYVGAMRDAFAQQGVDMMFLQGAAGNVNASTRLTKEKHGLNYKQVGQELCSQATAVLPKLTACDPGLWQVDNFSYTATVDHSDDGRYSEASAFVDLYYEQFPGNQAPQAERLAWCAQRGWTCVFEASSIIRRYNIKAQTEQMSLNTLALGKHFGIFTAPGELFDTMSMEVEASSPFTTTFCMGYAMGSHKYFIYDPNTENGDLTYKSYEGFNRNYVSGTNKDMIAYWIGQLEAFYASAR